MLASRGNVVRVTLSIASLAIVFWTALTAWDAEARACSQPASSIEIQSDGATRSIPIEGPIVIPVTAEGAGLEEFRNAVRLRVTSNSAGDAGSEEVPGTTEVRRVAYWYENPTFVRRHQRWLIVWTPAVPLTEGVKVDAAIEVDTNDINRAFVTIEARQFGVGVSNEPDPPVATPEPSYSVGRAVVSESGATRCSGGGGGSCPDCSFTDKREYVAVRVTLRDIERYRRPDVLYEVRATDPEAALDRRARFWGERLGVGDYDVGERGTLHFEPGRDEYCFRMAAIDLASGDEVSSREVCADAPRMGMVEPDHDIGPLPGPGPDTGPDVGDAPHRGPDAGQPSDARGVQWGQHGGSETSGGCSCRASSESAPGSVAWLVALLVALGARRGFRREW